MRSILDRTEQYLKIIKETIVQKKMPISEIYYSEGRNVAEWQSFNNDYWGKNDTWYTFKAKIKIPEEYSGERVDLKILTGREDSWNALNPQFLVRINGKIVQALDTNHHTVCITTSAVKDDEYDISLEAYAGREYDNLKFYDHPLILEMFTFVRSSTAEKLYFDIYTAWQAASMFSKRDYNSILIESHLENALNYLDVRVPSSPEYFDSVLKASHYMQTEFYEKVCGQNRVIADCIGHTHIDVAWLWRVEQTRSKAVRSFSTELALMDEYPEHRFMSSQPQLYQFVKEDAPEVYERIKKSVKNKQWEVEGAMWLESDCNVPSGESLVRQILHGKRFMKEEFGVDSKILWLPDVFGYNAAMPQIMKKSGIDTFVTSKIHWNETNTFPYDTFYWKGIDGTEIFSHFITVGSPDAVLENYEDTFSTYVGHMNTVSIAKGWELYKQKNINNEFLVTFGFGDGGGGVTRKMIEMEKRMSYGLPGMPKTRIITATEAIDNIKKNVAGKKIPKWFGELYLERHRGTYTSMGKNKLYNRTSEFLLQRTEALSLTDKVLLGAEYAKQQIYDSWTTVLLNQFHDIIPGSSIKEVYEDTDIQYTALILENEARSDAALYHLAEKVSKKGIFVYNPTGISQSGLITIDGKDYYINDVPALGWRVINESESTEKELSITKNHMENQFFSVDFDETMAITNFYDKRNHREIIKNGERGNVLEVLDDQPLVCDNWELMDYCDEIKWEINDVIDVDIEQEEERASLIITRNFMNSQLVQKIIIYKDIPRIDFDTDVDWHEHHMFVKAAFPVDVLSDRATYEIQYGAIERPTHKNTTWDGAKFEVCSHKWMDYAEADYGVAIMNDCKYGGDIHDGVMRISLIKCGTYPNPEADIGKHHFCYSVMPHKGDWRESNIVKASYELNCPLIAIQSEGKGDLPYEYSLVSVDKPNVVITAAKEACDNDDIIIRMYEAHGRRCEAVLSLGFKVGEAYEADLMENVTDKINVDAEGILLTFKPYEIKTIRLVK